MILTTTEFIPDCEITKIINIVSGNNILDLKTIKLDIRGGKYAQEGASLEEICPTILKNARTVAINKMVEEATLLNADAIICMKIETNMIGKVIEVVACGTAVNLLSFEDECMDDEFVCECVEPEEEEKTPVIDCESDKSV
jgi:uncharacterized protein YbjQ (UPF0145 family)